MDYQNIKTELNIKNYAIKTFRAIIFFPAFPAFPAPLDTMEWITKMLKEQWTNETSCCEKQENQTMILTGTITQLFVTNVTSCNGKLKQRSTKIC